jgi:hypothetical protein
MANCEHLFSIYNDQIRIGSKKNRRMMDSKNALRKRIRKWFDENQPEYEPKFFIQGSYKMKTGIRTKDDVCDLDDGVYFFRQPDVTSTTLQGWIWEAVKDYTETEPEHRKKCIRSVFAGDYEIDHPVYYKIDGLPYRIAVKDAAFENSDPKEVVDWFNRKKDKEGRLIAQVMNLKGWCDHKRNKMPSGLAMTILASNAKSKIVLNERADITLRDILKEIKKALDNKFECVVPAVPGDDLFVSYDPTRKKNFLDALGEFISDADKALHEENELSASKLWRKHLGDRFPLGEDKKQGQSQSRVNSAIVLGAATSNPWGK